MRKRILQTPVLTLLLACLAGLPCAMAQETSKELEPKLKPAESYRVEFTVNELEAGKKINSRSYSMQIRAEAIPKFSDMKRLRVGSRVPVITGPNQNQYIDVGMDIDCRLMPMGNGKVAMGANLADSSLEAQSLEAQAAHVRQDPVIRTVRAEVESILTLDKPTVLAEMDDVASTHRFVFEVKVTKTTE